VRRNCLLKHVIEGKVEGRVEVTGKRGKRSDGITWLTVRKRGKRGKRSEGIPWMT
jgi:hypothetical protein